MDQSTFIYTILDAARLLGELNTAHELEPEFLNLHKGQPDELDAVAPYLFPCQHSSELENWLQEKGWGKSWGVYLESPVAMDELLQHFKKFLVVYSDERGEEYFRFYDPRVMRIFLPTYNTQQLTAFFGPVQKFICEDEDPGYALLFSQVGGKLMTEKVAVNKIFPAKKKLDTKVVTSEVKSDYSMAETRTELKANKTPRKFF